MYPALESLALEQLHRDEMPSAVLSDLVDRADIRVVQSGCGARFALKTIERQRVLFRLRGEEFEGNVTAEVDVLGLVDDPHPPASQLREDTVVRDGLANHFWTAHGRATHVRPTNPASQNRCRLYSIEAYTRWRCDWFPLRRDGSNGLDRAFFPLITRTNSQPNLPKGHGPPLRKFACQHPESFPASSLPVINECSPLELAHGIAIASQGRSSSK